eukprot:103693_1
MHSVKSMAMFQQLHTPKKAKYCVKSVKYLQIIGESFWSWVILVVRDIFRLAIFVSQLLLCYYDNGSMIVYLILIPHCIFCILFVASKIYSFKQENNEFDLFQWCFVLFY